MTEIQLVGFMWFGGKRAGSFEKPFSRKWHHGGSSLHSSGCAIEDDCLIGMGAIVMNGAEIGRCTIIAAGAVVLEKMMIPPYSLVTGVPGKVKKTFSEGESLARYSRRSLSVCETRRPLSFKLGLTGG